MVFEKIEKQGDWNNFNLPPLSLYRFLLQMWRMNIEWKLENHNNNSNGDDLCICIILYGYITLPIQKYFQNILKH